MNSRSGVRNPNEQLEKQHVAAAVQIDNKHVPAAGAGGWSEQLGTLWISIIKDSLGHTVLFRTMFCIRH
jgi:hypothetical protein